MITNGMIKIKIKSLVMLDKSLSKIDDMQQMLIQSGFFS